MELQTFALTDQYRYVLYAKDVTESSAIDVVLQFGDEYMRKLSASTAVKLFLLYPKLHRLFNKFSFQGLITYRVDVDEQQCVTIELKKTFDKIERRYIREWGLNFTDLETLKTTRWPFAWNLLPLLMSKSVELIKAINHWELQLKEFHQSVLDKQENDNAPSTPTVEDNTYDVINKEWVKTCACCASNEPADIKLLQVDMSSEAAAWKGKPYAREAGDEKVESAIALTLDRYGKENYF
jgi:hypothetical protein